MELITLFLNNLSFNWSITEIVAVIFSIIYVTLAAQKNIWCWFFAAISVILYIYICWNAKLYAETALQIFYLFMAAYGYHNWRKSRENSTIKEWRAKKHLFIILIGSICTFFVGFYFTTYSQAEMPIIDSLTTVFSIIATYMVAKKILENWLYWIIINLISIYLYFNRDLHLTSILFIIYTIIAIFGYFSWIKKSRENG